MLRENIHKDIVNAMKAKEVTKLEALRYVWSRIKEVEIDKKEDLNDEEILTIVTKEVKSRKEAIDQFRNAKRDDLVEEEEKKLVFLIQLLPEQMNEREVEKVVEEVLRQAQDKLEKSDFGAVMGKVMSRVKGKADGGMVSRVVKNKIS